MKRGTHQGHCYVARTLLLCLPTLNSTCMFAHLYVCTLVCLHSCTHTICMFAHLYVCSQNTEHSTIYTEHYTVYTVYNFRDPVESRVLEDLAQILTYMLCFCSQCGISNYMESLKYFCGAAGHHNFCLARQVHQLL